MESSTFNKFRDIIYRESGIVLPPEKQPLLQNRIRRRLKELKINSDKEYLQIIETDCTGEELTKLVDAVSTNVTYFYREAEHFNSLRTILSESDDQKSDIRIWCAAASSGEEPYTIAFEALEILSRRNQNFKILATDICTRVLKSAQIGTYSAKQVQPVPAEIRQKFMSASSISGEDYWTIKPEVAFHILFRKLNLVHFPYALKGPIDIIFCRNVMIYFDKPTRAKIIKEFERLLKPGGHLFLSHSENLLGIEHNFEKLGASIFRKL